MSPVVLTVLIAWALLAVLFLIGTLLAARSIDRSVAVIKPNVIEIGEEGQFIAQAKTISETSTKIRAAADPLSPSLARTLQTARTGIDPKLKRILGKVGQINQTADSINGTVLTIGSTVDSIFASADSINGSVRSIRRKGNSILNSAQEINGSARNILTSGGAILDRVNSIDRAVATVIGQATDVNTTADAIQQDFVGIDRNVADDTRRGGSNITSNANRIDCAAAVNGSGCKR